jgi:hypothetical protein
MVRSLSHPPMARIDLPHGRSARVLSWDEVSRILSGFDQLDPFVDGQPFWTLDRTRSGRPLWAVVWGSKRHALFVPPLDCRVASSTEHVLGAYAPPPSIPGRRADRRHLWTQGVAKVHAHLAYEGKAIGVVSQFAWEPHDGDFPAFKRLSISGPEALAQMPADLGLHPFARVVEVEASLVNGPADRSRLVAPDPGSDLSDWQPFPGTTRIVRRQRGSARTPWTLVRPSWRRSAPRPSIGFDRDPKKHQRE